MFLKLLPSIIFSPAYMVGLLIGLIACIKMSACLKSASVLFLAFGITTAVGAALFLRGGIIPTFI